MVQQPAFDTRMTRIGVVIPTVAGREWHLAKAIKNHCPPWAERTDQVQFGLRVIPDRPTCGEAWNEGVDQLLAVGCDYILLTADDLEPREQAWWRPAVAAVAAGVIPCARTYGPDGSEQNTDVNPATFPRVPFLPASLAADIFPIPPLHYHSDILIGEMIEVMGCWEMAYVDGFGFVHDWAQPGRHHDDTQDRAVLEMQRAQMIARVMRP